MSINSKIDKLSRLKDVKVYDGKEKAYKLKLEEVEEINGSSDDLRINAYKVGLRDDYNPSFDLLYRYQCLYKIGDKVKTPKGSKRIEEIRISSNIRLYFEDEADVYTAENEINIYYKFSDGKIYIQDALLKYHKTGEYNNFTETYLSSNRKPVKVSMFRRFLNWFKR